MSLRARIIGLLVAVLSGLAPTVSDADEPPVRRIDRMWVVGEPVFEGAPRGLYVWVEDGAIQLAALGKGRIRVRVSSTEALELKDLGDFSALGPVRRGSVVIQSKPSGAGPARGRLRSDGDVTFSEVRSRRGRSRPVYLGPLARPGVDGVTVGRF